MKSPLALTPAEVELFRQQGFLGPFTAFDESAMASIRDVILDRVLPVPASHSPYASHCRHLDSRTVYETCAAPAIVDRMASVYGPDLLLWASAFFDKPPARDGREEAYPWHQDLYNWRLEPMLNISAWLAITPATRENGCVEVIPGSHKQIVPPVRDTDERISYRFAGAAADPAYFDASQAVALELRAGQFFLFNERTLHRSHPNRTDERRIGLAMRVTTPIAKSHESWPCVRLCGKDDLNFNEYVEPPQLEPDDQWRERLPTNNGFCFDGAIPGLGWHLPERDGDRCFAWTGEEEAWLDLAPETLGERRLRCEVLHAIQPDCLDAVEIRVNGELIALQRSAERDITVLTGDVSERAMSLRDPVRVTVRAPLARPCDIHGDNGDNRMLGLGISKVSLDTARRSWFTALQPVFDRIPVLGRARTATP